MRKLLYFFAVCFSFLAVSQQKPKLVVGIVVDQMRQDYISRYYDDFENGGFKRLIDQGFFFKNAHYNYLPTKTGPGHASIFTGTTPARHGIIGNDWYIPSLNKNINCVGDSIPSVVGGVSNGNVSPRNLQVTTITDELKLFYNFTSKVVGVSLKDRGAVLPSGHNPDGAYWYDLQSGKMITSTYYMKSLPKWVKDYNDLERPKYFLGRKWELLKDKSSYNESIDDENPYESELRKGLGVAFPHDLPKYKDDLSLLKYTPFTNTMIKEMAIKAVKEEQMGSDSIPDFLTISFSATDDIGHRFGPRSVEVQDTYLRLDRELRELLTFLDEEVGKGEYLIFLSADHGATDVPAYMHKMKMPSGYHNNGYLKSILQDKLEEKFGSANLISSIINEQIYLNHSAINERKLNLVEIKKETINILLAEDYVVEAFDAELVARRMFTDQTLIRLQNGYERKRSGDILYLLTPSDLNDSYGREGTDHRTSYTYDTHVPIIFYGMGIPKGNSIRSVSITDIAPSLSMLLNISLPNSSTGKPLTELFD